LPHQELPLRVQTLLQTPLQADLLYATDIKRLPVSGYEQFRDG
jgi:hypothetical protein